MQWGVIGIYVALLVLPLFAPEPTRHSHIWTNAVLFAQFAFWGIWWPFVLVSMVLVGRSWCGLFCPEGALAEMASLHGLGRATPRWIKWRGWPFAAFVLTTIYGQMVSVYQYPKPVIIVLGGSTLAAMAIGLLYGRSKRVWCRYLCPVSGVFAVLAKLSPLHYRVDNANWTLHRPDRKAAAVNCAPLVPIPTMKGASSCHMCGRCAGFRQAVTLEARAPNHEIVFVAGLEPKPWETALIVFGLLGIAAGAFLWASSPLFVTIKQGLAGWLVDHGLTRLLEPVLPWWVLTNYPDQNDMMSPLDGALMIVYVLGTAAITGGVICAFLALAAAPLDGPRRARFHHLAQGLIPLAGCGVFLGLSTITISMLKAEGLESGIVPALRMALLAAAALWSLALMRLIAARYAGSMAARAWSLLGSTGAVAAGSANLIMLLR